MVRPKLHAPPSFLRSYADRFLILSLLSTTGCGVLCGSARPKAAASINLQFGMPLVITRADWACEAMCSRQLTGAGAIVARTLMTRSSTCVSWAGLRRSHGHGDGSAHQQGGLWRRRAHQQGTAATAKKSALLVEQRPSRMSRATQRPRSFSP